MPCIARASLRNSTKRVRKVRNARALAPATSTTGHGVSKSHGKLKVVSMLESLPGVGKVRARRLMEELDISENRRLRGLGDNQRQRLLDRFA